MGPYASGRTGSSGPTPDSTQVGGRVAFHRRNQRVLAAVPHPSSDQHVAALDVFAEVLIQSDTGVTSDAFYSRLCEAVCGLARMDRAVLFRYDGALRRVRAAGAHGVSLALFEDELFSVESAEIARRSLQDDRVIEESRRRWTASCRARYVDLLRPSHVVCTPMAAAGRWVGVILADRARDAPRLDDNDRDAAVDAGQDGGAGRRRPHRHQPARARRPARAPPRPRPRGPRRRHPAPVRRLARAVGRERAQPGGAPARRRGGAGRTGRAAGDAAASAGPRPRGPASRRWPPSWTASPASTPTSA